MEYEDQVFEFIAAHDDKEEPTVAGVKRILGVDYELAEKIYLEVMEVYPDHINERYEDEEFLRTHAAGAI